MKKKIIAPSILSADFSQLGQEIQSVEQAGADLIHIDVMDGHFVPNITMGPCIIQSVKKITSLPFDVHLMIENPDKYILDFIKSGADYISVHAEACVHLHRTIQIIKENHVKAGVALNPATSLSAIEWILDELDFVTIMTVNPGFGGQKFIPSSLKKIQILKSHIQQASLTCLIQVDGGVNQNTIESIDQAGADIFVAGSAIFNSSDYQQTISKLKQ